MDKDKVVTWYKEQLEKGLSKKELAKLLQDAGYSKKELNELMPSFGKPTHVKKHGTATTKMGPSVEDMSHVESLKPWERTPKPSKTPVEEKPSIELNNLTKKPKAQKKQAVPAKTRKKPEEKIRKETTVEELKISHHGPVPPRPPKKKTYRHVGARFSKTVPLPLLITQEIHFFWKVIIIAIVFVLLVIGSFLVLIYKNADLQLTVDPFTPTKIDDIPPKVTIIPIQSEWIGADKIDIECQDSGIDFSSGCVDSSYSYYLSEVQSCPQDYSLYSTDLSEGKEGFLCVAAMDAEGNAGFSAPVHVKFDLSLPSTSIETKKDWFNASFFVDVTDFDEGSGADKCFYSVSTVSYIVLDWTSRECNSSVSVPVGTGGCNADGEGACVVKVYAVDRSGNTGEFVEASYSVDLEKPTVEITSVSNSDVVNGVVVVHGTVVITGTARDANFEEYTLRWEKGSLSSIVSSSSEQIFGKSLGSLDTTLLPNGAYLFVLTATDLSGKAASHQFQVNISNGQSCTAGETETCTWREGVCSSSVRACGSDGSWGECDVGVVADYESVEVSCDDGLDNDCNGMADDDDPTCGEDCVSDCSSGSTRCVGNFEESCADCDDDSCLEWCNPVNCSDCSCTCGNYTSSGNESHVEGGCSDGVDNDCDSFVDELDSNCIPCSNECTSGQTNCSESTSTIFICSDCDLDDCIEWCTLDDCSDCSCTCGNYTTGVESSVSGGCGDGVDNDCNEYMDCDDSSCAEHPDCMCAPEGGYCFNDSDCCTGYCDMSENHCMSCEGIYSRYDSFDGKCEFDCGATYMFDEQVAGYIDGNRYCCRSTCWYDTTVGSCTCPYSGTCVQGNGYCVTSTYCFYNIYCSSGGSGWQCTYGCPLSTCLSHTLTVNRQCADTGCSGGTQYACNSENHCTGPGDGRMCAGETYYCTTEHSTSWEWRSTLPAENCTDGWDNDCDTFIDCVQGNEDPDCGCP